MRPRDPRRLLANHRRARARVRIVDVPQPGHAPDGAIASRQEAEITLPRSELDALWSPEHLERLARTYWRFLTRVSLGLLRMLYTETARELVLLTRPIVLMRFCAPDYEIEPDRGTVTWRIEKGMLVAPGGRGRGYLRISVRRPPQAGEEVTARVSSEVASFYPLLAGWGWFSRIGRVIYRFTQLQVHVVVTHAFFRSLSRLDLARSKVGAMQPDSATPAARR